MKKGGKCKLIKHLGPIILSELFSKDSLARKLFLGCIIAGPEFVCFSIRVGIKKKKKIFIFSNTKTKKLIKL